MINASDLGITVDQRRAVLDSRATIVEQQGVWLRVVHVYCFSLAHSFEPCEFTVAIWRVRYK